MYPVALSWFSSKKQWAEEKSNTIGVTPLQGDHGVSLSPQSRPGQKVPHLVQHDLLVVTAGVTLRPDVLVVRPLVVVRLAAQHKGLEGEEDLRQGQGTPAVTWRTQLLIGPRGAFIGAFDRRLLDSCLGAILDGTLSNPILRMVG